MTAAIEKWMGYASLLTKGRFDFFTAAQTAPRWNTMFNCMAMTLGRWWTRTLGGTNLRRAEGDRIPTMADPICGRSDGPVTSIRDNAAMIGHAAGSRFVYGISCVGAGGVEEPFISSIREVVFDAGALWAGLVPNAAMGLSARANKNGSFTLIWRYDAKGQQAAPSLFNVYSSVKNGTTVDYSAAIGTVTYDADRSEYSYTTGVLSDSTNGLYLFGVRAESATGAEEQNEITAMVRNTTTAPYGTVKVYGGGRELVPSAGAIG